MFRTTVLAAALAATAIASAASTQASTMRQSYQVKVSYSDLDLGTEAGANALNIRIGNAARKACRKVNEGIHAQSQCQMKAIALAAPRADAVVLAARMYGKTAQG